MIDNYKLNERINNCTGDTIIELYSEMQDMLVAIHAETDRLNRSLKKINSTVIDTTKLQEVHDHVATHKQKLLKAEKALKNATRRLTEIT